MHVPINLKSPNNISEWQKGYNSAFKGLISPLAGGDRGLLVGPLGHLSDYGRASVASQAAEGQSTSTSCVMSRSVCSYKSCVPCAEDKPDGSNVESGPGYLGSMSVCGAAQWGKLSESWSKFKFTDFHVMLLHST